jgi:hypothetical protein
MSEANGLKWFLKGHMCMNINIIYVSLVADKDSLFFAPSSFVRLITFPDSLVISRVRYLSSSHMTVSWYLGLLNPKKSLSSF